jgi:CheY-like chemotaxis protein
LNHNEDNFGLLDILLVEDNKANQKVILAMLGRLGYSAQLAVNGFDALKALNDCHFDIVLMDIHMPKMDGLQTTKAIRARWSPVEQPYIIAITAYALVYSIETCISAGMDDYLCKPFSLKELENAISGYEKMRCCLVLKPCFSEN